MTNKRISVLDIFKSTAKFRNRFKEQEPVEEISYFVHISYDTNGQVKYLDEKPDIEKMNQLETMKYIYLNP